MGTTKNIGFFFLQVKITDFLTLDPFDDTVPIGSLFNGDGQVSVTRSYDFFLRALHTS